MPTASGSVTRWRFPGSAAPSPPWRAPRPPSCYPRKPSGAPGWASCGWAGNSTSRPACGRGIPWGATSSRAMWTGVFDRASLKYAEEAVQDAEDVEEVHVARSVYVAVGGDGDRARRAGGVGDEVADLVEQQGVGRALLVAQDLLL